MEIKRTLLGLAAAMMSYGTMAAQNADIAPQQTVTPSYIAKSTNGDIPSFALLDLSFKQVLLKGHLQDRVQKSDISSIALAYAKIRQQGEQLDQSEMHLLCRNIAGESHFDVAEFGRQMNKIDDRKNAQMSQNYNRLLNRLSPQAQTLVAELNESSAREKHVVHNQMDYEALAQQDPEFFAERIRKGCQVFTKTSQKAVSNLSGGSDYAADLY